MCPGCMAGIAMVAATTASAGGLAALIANKVRAKPRMKGRSDRAKRRS
jgi:hypothetical protein